MEKLIVIWPLIFYYLKHPLILVLVLLVQTLIIFTIMYTSLTTIWFRFLFFLIFIGGLLIIFIYLSALIPNEIFSINSASTFPIIITITVIITSPFLPRIQKRLDLNFNVIPLNYRGRYTRSFIIIIIVYLLATLRTTITLCQKTKAPLKNISYVNTKNSPYCVNCK